MKKLIFTVVIGAFALASSAQAGQKSKASGSCCTSASTSASAVKSGCTSGQVSACGAKSKEARKSAPATARGAYLAMLAQR